MSQSYDVVKNQADVNKTRQPEVIFSSPGTDETYTTRYTLSSDMVVIVFCKKLTTTYITPKIWYLYILWPVITPGWVNP